jgi:uncharacterized protein (TIRG00374 family)
MTQPKKPFRPNLISIVLVLGLVAFIAYFIFYVNPTQVIAILSQINPLIYVGAFAAYCLFVLFSSLVWRSLLGSLSVKISARKALLYAWVGLFFEATIPQMGWSGEVSKTYLLSKDSKLDTGKIAASVVGQKLFIMTMTISALTVGLISALFSYQLPPVATFLIATVLALSIATLAVVYYVSVKPSATKKLLGWGIKLIRFFKKSWNPETFKLKAEETLGNFHVGITQLKANPKGLILPAICTVASFACEVSVVFLCFLALGQPLPIGVVLIVFTLTGTLQTIGVTFFGFPEVIMSASFTALLIDPALGFSVTLLTRVVNLWFRLVVSYAALQWAGVQIIKKDKAPKLDS